MVYIRFVVDPIRLVCNWSGLIGPVLEVSLCVLFGLGHWLHPSRAVYISGFTLVDHQSPGYWFVLLLLVFVVVAWAKFS